MRTLGPLQGTAEPTPQDGARHLVECNWKTGFSLEIPKDWLSGVYLGKLSTIPTVAGQFLDLEMHSESYFVFIIRDDRKADLLFQASDMTWLSYNRWPQWRSLYDLGPHLGERTTPRWATTSDSIGLRTLLERIPGRLPPAHQRLRRVPDDRVPARLLAREGRLRRHLHLERRHPRRRHGLLRAKAFLSVGHDEYWTDRMFENVTKARDAGVSLAFLSGNAVSGVVELLPSSDGRPNRVMRRAGRGFQGEQELMGATSYGVGFADWTSDRPEHWAFEGTNMKKGDRVAQLVGWEYHGAPLGKHPDLVVLSEGPVYGNNGERRSGTYATTIYTAAKGNLVFNAGTCWWNLVLSTPPGFQNPPRKDFMRTDARIQRITKNILDRMVAAKIPATVGR